MEIRTVSDLRKNMEQAVLDLGVDSRFKENPAFSNVLKEIQRVIQDIHMGTDEELQPVKQQANSLSFEYVRPEDKGIRYSFSLLKNHLDQISVEMQTSRTSFNQDDRPIRVRSTTTLNCTLDRYGGITIDKLYSRADTMDCGDNEYNVQPMAQRDVYNDYGVMVEHEQMISNPVLKFRGNIDQTPGFSPFAVIENRTPGYYEVYEHWRRDSVDTAAVLVDDKKLGREYTAILPLSLQHGPRRMEIPELHDYPEEVVIPTITEADVDRIIEMEGNEKVKEGLRKFGSKRCVGQQGIYFDSKTSRAFTRSGFEDEVTPESDFEEEATQRRGRSQPLRRK